ncbi:MAG: DUF1616 domain-containing protein [Oscillochloris sp.]|nr:DUF1616 domain-containing protein [Oscillochloris sp.]
MEIQIKPAEAFVRRNHNLRIGADLALSVTAAALLLLLVFAGERGADLKAPRLVLGLAYALFVPGYLICAAVFPYADAIASSTRIGLSFGLSVAITPIIAIGLDRLPWGITPIPITVAMMLIVVAGAAAVTYRRSSILPERIYMPGLIARRPQLGAALVAMLLSLAVILLACAPLRHHEPTEIYAVGQEGHARDYPGAVVIGQPVSLTIGVYNAERAATHYQIQVRAQAAGQAGTTLAESTPFLVGPHERTEQIITWKMSIVGPTQAVTIDLIDRDRAQVTRQLMFWLDVSGAP